MEIKGKVIFPESHEVEFVNGAFGGINNHGEIVIHFFKDLKANAESVSIIFEEGQTPKEQLVKTNDFIRNVKSSIIMTLETAKSVSRWLDNTIKQLEFMKPDSSMHQAN